MEEGRDLEEQSDERPAGLLYLYIDCVQGLVEPECPAHIPRPVVRLRDPCTHTLRLVRPRHGETTSQPVIEQSIVFVIKRPLTDEVRVEVVDLAGESEKVIGTCYINVWRDLVLPGLTRPLSPWRLEGRCPEGVIEMAATLRGLAPPRPEQMVGRTEKGH